MVDTFLAAAGAAAQDLHLLSGQALVALLTLTALEIVLGIDNIVFIAILVGKLPENRRGPARKLGLTLAMGIRILLLLTLSWIMGLKETLFELPAIPGLKDDTLAVTGKDLILFAGGLFLIAKSTYEIHDKLESTEYSAAGASAGGAGGRAGISFGTTIVQILLLDIVFSLDSVITAVGMVQTSPSSHWAGLTVMITAIVIAVAVMLVFAGSVSRFVETHPTIKMLALSFLLLIGVMLVVEAFEYHIPKGYIYFAMAFSLGVEMLNLRLRQKAEPVQLRHASMPESRDAAR